MDTGHLKKEQLEGHVELYKMKLDEFCRAEEKFRPKSGLGFSDKKWDEKLQNAFFDRMDENVLRREIKVERMEKEVYDEQYPFKPQVASRKDDDDVDENYDPLAEFLERYESDLDARREKSKAFWSEARQKLEEENHENYHHDLPFKP